MLATAHAARDQLVESHLDYARKLASRLARRLPRHVDQEELESDACLGLLEAACAFDPARGVKFRTYATRRIVGKMLDGLRQRGQIRRRGDRPRQIPLHQPVFDRFDGPLTIADCIAANQPAVGLAIELRDEAEHAMRGWPSRLRQTLRDAHLHGLNQEQIARKQGVSPSCICLRMTAIRGLAAQARETSHR